MSDDGLAPGTVIDNRYVVEDELGRGGMAVVYRVRHRTLGTPMALKLLTVSRGNVRERLVKEGRVQAALRHPNVVAVLDTVQVGERIGLVMEYVRGPSLYTLTSEMRLDWQQMDDIARGLFDGIEAAHNAGLVHRDLKPDNVLIEIAPGRLIPKVADFGLVKNLEDDAEGKGKTRTGSTFGTPEYMAPEQISDAKSVDRRADVFSVGVMLFEIVTGQKPFAHDDLLELFNRIAKGTRLRVDALRPDAPERMIRAIDAALVPDRTLRAATIAEIRALWTDGIEAHQAQPWTEPMIEQVRKLGRGEEGIETLRKARSLQSVDPLATGATGQPERAPGWTAGASPSVIAIEEAPARRRLWAGVGVVGGSLALVFVGVALLGALGVYALVRWPSDPDPAPSVAEGPEVAPEAAPDVVAEAEAVAEAEPVPAAEPPSPVGVVARAAPAPSPEEVPPVPEVAPEGVAPAVVAPEVAPEPAVAAVAPAEPTVAPPQVRLQADKTMTVALQDGTGRPVELGAVDPGTYRVFAWYEEGKDPAEVGDPIHLAAGDRWVVRCVRDSHRCNVTKEKP